MHEEYWTIRRTDMAEVIGAFRDYANAPNKEKNIPLYIIIIKRFKPL